MFQQHTITFLECLSSYAGMFFVRDCITSSSSHLSKLGYFTSDQYSIFVACNYALQSISRLGGGFIIDWTNQPKMVYIATCAIAIASIFTNSFLAPHHQSTVVLIGMTYVTIKVMCSFSRNSLMKVLGRYYEHRDFGTVNNLLSGVGAMSNAGCMLLMTLLYKKDWHWQHICFLISGIVILLNIPSLFIKEKNTKSTTNTAAVPLNSRQHQNTKTGLSLLAKKPHFHVLLVLSSSVAIVRINTSYISW